MSIQYNKFSLTFHYILTLFHIFYNIFHLTLVHKTFLSFIGFSFEYIRFFKRKYVFLSKKRIIKVHSTTYKLYNIYSRMK